MKLLSMILQVNRVWQFCPLRESLIGSKFKDTFEVAHFWFWMTDWYEDT